MQNSNRTSTEKYISKTFNGQSKHFDKSDTNGLSKTAIHHIDQISQDQSLETAIDVGSGTGGILEGLLDHNLSFVYGVDLAPNMIELAQKRLEQKGYLNKSKIENISFLDYSFEKNIDAISLHRVLCCHPDRVGMLQKAISAKPKLIVITIPRRWFFLRIGIIIASALRKIKKGFRPYLHKYNEIDSQLKQANYQLIDVFKTGMWITRTYKLQPNHLN